MMKKKIQSDYDCTHNAKGLIPISWLEWAENILAASGIEVGKLNFRRDAAQPVETSSR